MTAFENFVNTELPRRPTLLTQTLTGYTGNPNLSSVPLINNSPEGNLFLDAASGQLWQKLIQASPTSWIPVGGGTTYSYISSTNQKTHIYVDASLGNDTNNGNSWATAKLTLNAGWDALPQCIAHPSMMHCKGTFTDTIDSSTKLLLANLYISGTDDMTVFAGPYTATGSSSGTVTVSGASWTVDTYAGYMIKFLSGTLINKVFNVWGNTANTITFTGGNPGLAQFQICNPATTFNPSMTYNFFKTEGAAASLILQKLTLNATCITEGPYNSFTALVHLNGNLSVQRGFISSFNPNLAVTDNLTLDYNYMLCSFSGRDIAINTEGFAQVSMLNSIIKGGITLKDVRINSVIQGCRIIGNVTCLNSNLAAGALLLQGVTIDYSGAGSNSLVLIDGSNVDIGTCTINNSPTHGIEIKRSNVKFTNVVGGTGNVGAGVYVYNNSSLTLPKNSPPTITGTVGNLAISDPTVQEATWAEINSGTIVSITDEATLVRAR